MSTTLRGLPSRVRRCCRIIIIPVSSPCAPAAGCSVTAGSPVISPSISASACMIASAPCATSSGASGCSSAKPGIRAAASFTFGLYFIVHEPSGYMPVSTP